MAHEKEIWVYMDHSESEHPIPMGVLHSEVLRGKEVFSFENDSEWLKHKEFRALDPDLAQFAGKQYLPADKSNFGLFLDSAPDRWGRMLMRRREAIEARRQGRPPRVLTEADYLLGVYDGNRMGALRFKASPDGAFLDDRRELATPPWASIRDLEYASLQLEREELQEDAEYARWLDMLIAPGSSLGGARPKANIRDHDGNLWIAKFPSGHDTKDMGAWEAVTAELARRCGIEMSECRAQRFSGRQHTFLTERFDRMGARRIHFASAMTLLGYTDGADAATGVSYLELAEWIGSHCDCVSQNLEQLWRRIVFNVAVSNCDDHLRNHGFLLTSRGWMLSPAYDINPDEQGMGLKLNISENDNSLDFELVLSVASYFGVDAKHADRILKEVRAAVTQWREVAAAYDIPRSEQEMIAGAFKI
ncbi:MAG: HipA domain-containing protein [Bacteroides cellulosilyticus]|nr:HipA domain-containing protein [Bacteroides cellulosilyticus]